MNLVVNGETVLPKRQLNFSRAPSQKTLNYAELVTLFSMIANTVDQRPIAARNFTDNDFEAITPNDLLLQSSRNKVPGILFEEGESLNQTQVVMQEMEKNVVGYVDYSKHCLY